MNIAIFGLTVSSSWGNGHAAVWRGLCRALGRRGHPIDFFERDVPYYAAHRDEPAPEGAALHLYASWSDALPEARAALERADAAIVTSYCPDAVNAADLVLSSRVPIRAYYDLDTPVTLARIREGRAVEYVPPGGLGDFDVVLSQAGGRALEELESRLGARRVVPLFGGVDPDLHRPVAPRDDWRSDLSYLGTGAEDRQAELESLFLEPARRLPGARFVLGGAQYSDRFPWARNVYFVRHVAPPDHPAFFASSRLTLDLARREMADMGWCPSGRIFEAAACGVPLVSDAWEGLDAFLEPGTQVLPVRDPADVLAAMALPDAELRAIADAARERTLDEHTADRRAVALVQALETRPRAAAGT